MPARTSSGALSDGGPATDVAAFADRSDRAYHDTPATQLSAAGLTADYSR